MKILKINPTDIHITPTDKKIKKIRAFVEKLGPSGLPVEMPVERNIYLETAADTFDKIKNRIQLAVERISTNK